MSEFFGKNLRYLRKLHKYSQPVLGKKINKSESTIQMYETGKRMPTVGTATDIANIFNVSLNDLMNVDLQNKPKNENFTNYKKQMDIYQTGAFYYGVPGETKQSDKSKEIIGAILKLKQQQNKLKAVTKDIDDLIKELSQLLDD